MVSSYSSFFTLGERVSNDRWVGADSVPESDYFVEVKIILHLRGTEPRFIGYQYETNSTYEAICVVLCHVAIAYRLLATNCVKTQSFL
jgi:hypothetical protein